MTVPRNWTKTENPDLGGKREGEERPTVEGEKRQTERNGDERRRTKLTLFSSFAALRTNAARRSDKYFTKFPDSPFTLHYP
jgi:hypothetical protein